MKTAETDIIVYQETNVIECPDCFRNLLFTDLDPVKGNLLPRSDKPGCSWQSVYYHCKCGAVLVYDPGDGDPKRLVKGTFATTMSAFEAEMLAIANTMVAPHGLRAEFLGDFRSVGVGGDCRSYTRIIVLVGPYPGNDVLSALSTKISNTTGINRVAYFLARK